MTESENNEQWIILENNEKLSEKSTIKTFSKGFQNISKEYSKCHDPKSKEAHDLALKQLQTLKYKITKYREDAVDWLDMPEDTRWEIVSLETNFEDIINFLSKGVNDEAELYFIRHHTSMDTGEVDNETLLGFLSSKYTENGKIKDSILKKLNTQETFFQINAFLEKKTNYMPSFTNDDFEKNPELITKALSKPGTILSIYEWLISSTLGENQNFLKTINTILIQEYSDLFGKEKQTKLYGVQNGLNFDQIKTLLDIKKYYPFQTQAFVNMMNTSAKGDSRKALELYHKNFIWTVIGTKIYTLFTDSLFLVDVQRDALSTISNNQKKQIEKGSDIYHLISSGQKQKFAVEGFAYIAPENLNELLGKLPKIEVFCKNSDIAGLIKYLETSKIDILYKRLFFDVLENAMKDVDTYPQSSNFYSGIVSHYNKQLDLSVQKVDILSNSTHDNGKEEFTIIKQQFPKAMPEELKEKNNQLSNFLNNSFDSDGKMKVSSENFKKSLLRIFEGSPLYKKLNDPKLGGKEALKIVAEAAKEKKDQITSDIKTIDPTFNETKILNLKREDRENLRWILDGTASADTKIKALQGLGITSKEFQSWEDKEIYIKLVQWYLPTMMAEQAIISMVMDEKKLALFEDYWNGKIKSPEEFNKQSEKRDWEIKEQESKQEAKQQNVTIISPEWLNAELAKKDNIGQVISTFIKGKEVIMMRDNTEEVSIFSEGISIRKINIIDKENPSADIEKAMDSIQFLKDTWLDIFRSNMPAIIELIDNRPSRNGWEKINLSDGIDTEEGCVFLESIAKLVDISIPEWRPSEERFNMLKESFIAIKREGGLLSKLQNVWCAHNDQIDEIALQKAGIKKMT